MHAFERALSVAAEELDFLLRANLNAPWMDFWLNPRRLRGSDFLMRWSQGRWSEDRLIHAVNQSDRYYAIPYGPSGTAPQNDVRAFELYFEKLEAAGFANIKRPDVLVLAKGDKDSADALIKSLGGLEQLPFTPESERAMQKLLALSLIAVESENSLWKARSMPDFGRMLRPQKRLGGQLGLSKSAILPTIIIKEEDRNPLRGWQEAAGVPIHVWHLFYDLAYGLTLDDADKLVDDGRVLPTIQVFQAPGGATTKKAIYKFPYFWASYSLGTITKEPELRAECVEDKNGHVLPYVRFEGGEMRLDQAALDALDNLERR